MAGRRRLQSLRGTIRFRITALAAVAVAVVLAATGFALVTVQRSQLISEIDVRLEQRGADLTALLSDGPITLPETDADSFAQVVDPSGVVVAATPTLDGVGALPVVLDPGAETKLQSRDDMPPDDDLFRILSRRIETAQGPAVLHVGTSLDEVADSVGVLGASLGVTIPLVVALLAALVWVLVGRTLAPVETIRREVDAIGGGELQRRVDQPPGNDEISRLAATMNRMLARLEAAQARHQEFVADASHELRSPLTRMRTELEIDEAHAVDADLRATHRSLREDVVQLQRLVDDLLHLAQSDAAALPMRDDPIDVDDIVLREVERARAATSKSIDISGVSGGHVKGDRQQLSRAVRNLVDNAERHARTAVTIQVQEEADQTVVTVADDGPGVPTEQRQRMFDRFSRLDDARSRDAGGTGLGLAITRDIVQRHRGTISVGDSPTGGAEFVVRLPRAE